MRTSNGILVLAGGGALLAGVLTFGVSLGLALSTNGGTVAPAAALPAYAGIASIAIDDAEGAALTIEPDSEPGIDSTVLRLAVRSAPFEESRRPPTRRYELPGNELPPAPRVAARPEAPAFRMLGSVSMEGRSFAVLAVGDGAPQLVAAGDDLSGYTLAAVTSESAVMAGSGQILRLAMSQPAMTGAESPQGANRTQQRGRNANTPNQRAGAAPAVQIEEAMSAMRAGDIEAMTRAAGQILGDGAAPMIQGLMRQFQAGGAQGGGAQGGGAQGAAGLGGLIQLFGGGE